MNRIFGIIALVVSWGAAGTVQAQGTAAAQGKRVFDQWCSSCHMDSVRAPGTTALATKYGKEQPAVLEQRKDLTPDIVTYFVRHGVSIMPAFRKTEISDAELAAMAAYLSSAKTPKAKGRK